MHSLELTADGTAVRKPLLSRGAEFHEAILRLTRAYDPGSGGVGALMTPKRNRPLPRLSNAGMAATAQAAVSAAIQARTSSTPREVDETGEVGDEEAALLEKLPVVCGKLLADLAPADFFA